MTDHRPQRFNKHTNTWPITGRIVLLMESLWPVISDVFVCLLNRCYLWSVMYLCSCWIVVACDRSYNDSISRKMHDRSHATMIQQAQKYMTDHRKLRFNKHINTWYIIRHNACGPVICHVFVCLLNRCCLWSVIYVCVCWIVVACERSCIGE
jgi:hypothetical protein